MSENAMGDRSSFFDNPETVPSIDGATFDKNLDGRRLGTQLRAIFSLMSDGRWRSLNDICEELCLCSTAGVSARVRDLRKERFGGHMVERRRGSISGEWQYRLTINEKHDIQGPAKISDGSMPGASDCGPGGVS